MRKHLLFVFTWILCAFAQAQQNAKGVQVLPKNGNAAGTVALPFAAKTQNQFPPVLTSLVDARLEEAYAAHNKKDVVTTHGSLQQIDSLLATIQNDFPLYRGIVHLFQSYYTFDGSKRERYSAEGQAMLKDGGKLLADSFSTAIYNVMQLHYKAGRMAEWRGADSVFRVAVAGTRTPEAFRYGVLNYAGKKLDQKQYAVSRNLALYDYYTLMSRNSKDPLDKLVLMFDDWLILKGDLEQWKTMPYEFKYPEEFKNQGGTTTLLADETKETYKRLRSLDFRSTFKTLISRTKELKKQLVLENVYGSSGFRSDWRWGYYRIYSSILNDYYTWAVNEQKESLAILPFKEFLHQDLVPNEIEPAAKAGIKPVVNGTEIVTLFRHLANLYHGIGNGADEKVTVLYGLDALLSSKVFSQEEENYALITLLHNRVSAERLQRNYEASLKSSQSLKKFARLPDSATVRHKEQWENFMQVRIEEVYTLLASQKLGAARDSFAALMDQVTPLDNGTDFASLYSMKTWSHFQYLVAFMQAQHGKWMPELLRESIMDMDRLVDLPEIYFPVQLLYLKAIWYKEKKLSESLLSNLLFYTGRQLRFTFPMLAAEDRMRLFEQKLSHFFDVYHELLFSGSLDAYPQLKERVIAQSLSLKNALADGNLIPNALLEKKGSIFSVREIEALRDLRQDVNLYLQEGRLKKLGIGERRKMQDRVLTMWLELLEDSGMDSLSRLTDWRRISSRLKPGAVYTEVIRYNRWLSDSAAYYGAFILSSDGKLSLVPLFAEAKLTALLKDPAASPQTAALSSNGNRGGILLSKAKPSANTFQKGSVDKLGELLLKPLWPYLQGKEEWVLVQDGLLNRISFAALHWKSKNLFEYLQLSQLSGSYSIFQPLIPLPVKAPALLVGGLQYGDPATSNQNRLFRNHYYWNYLPGTRREVQNLQAQFSASGYHPRVLTGPDFPDSAMTILKQYPIIHLATHGFYLDSVAAAAVYTEQWDREEVKYEPLFRCGLAVSHANNPDEQGKAEGYLLGYELANVDLRNCYLIALSACETGLGDVRNNLGVDGLSRALKLSGARHLLISLWKVPDQPTALFMEQFYKHLFEGKMPAQALRATQAFMSKTYAATDWAAFVLVQ